MKDEKQQKIGGGNCSHGEHLDRHTAAKPKDIHQHPGIHKKSKKKRREQEAKANSVGKGTRTRRKERSRERGREKKENDESGKQEKKRGNYSVIISASST
jgi:hypothetical protein